MAKVKTSSTSSSFRTKSKKTRPGVHSKTRTSNHKGSKHYKKKYRGQG
jgi:hypothetical protein